MNKKPTYQELEKENELLRQGLEFGNSNEKFNSYFEHNKSVMLEIDTSNQKIINANNAAIDFYGYSKEEFLGKTVDEINILPIEKIRKVMAKAIEEKSNFFQFKHRLANNEIRDVEVYASPFKSDNEVHLFATVYDISLSQKAKQDLSASEARYKALSDATSEAIIISEDGFCIDTNDTATRIFGYSTDELVGMFGMEVIADESKKLVKENMLFGYKKPYKAMAQHKDGTKFPAEFQAQTFDNKGKEVRFTTIRDLSKQVASEKTLRKLSTAVEQSANSVVITDTEGIIEYVNPAFTELTGYSSEESIGQNPRFLNAGSQSDEYYENMWQMLTNGKVWIDEFHNRKKNGDLYWEMATISPIKDDTGKIINYIGIKEDITEEKRINQELILAKEKAEQNKQELQKQHKKLDTILNAYSDGVFLCSPKFEIEYLNPVMENIIGHKADGEKCYKAIYDKDDICEWCYLKELHKNKEITIERKKDNRHYVIKSLKLENNSILTTYHDVTDKKEAENKIIQSEREYRDLLNYATDAIYIQDEDACFIDVNQGVLDMYGYSKEYFIGKTPEFLSAPGKNDLAQIMKLVEKAYNGEAQQYEFWGIRKDGEVFPKIVRSQYGYYKGKKVIITFATDITERIKKEETLKESELQLRNIFENSSNLFYSHTIENIITYVSPQVQKILGYTQEELKIKWTETTSDNPANEIGYLSTQKAIDTGKPQPAYELELLHKNGNKIWVEVREGPVVENGKTVSIVGALTDITSKKKTENALKESEEKYKSAFSTSPDAININKLNGEYVEINEGFTALTGYTSEDIIGINPSEISIWENPKDREILINALKEKGEISNLETVFKMKNGNLKTALMSANIIYINNTPHILSITRDISKRKKFEKAIQESEQKFRSVVENMIDGFYRVDANGKMILISLSVTTITGFSEEEIIGQNADFFYANPNGRVEFLNEINKKGKVDNYQLKIKTKNNGAITIELNAKIIYDNNRIDIGVEGVFRDITQREKDEIALKYSEQKFRSVVENMIDGFAKINSNGIISYVNPAVTKIFGFSKDEIIGQHIQSFQVNQNDYQTDKNEIKNTGFKSNYTEEFITKNRGNIFLEINSLVIYDTDGNYNGIEAIFRDRTEHIKNEVALKDSEQKFRSVVENMIDCFFRADENGKIILISPSVIEITGYSEEEMLGNSIAFTYADIEKRDLFLKELRTKGRVDNYFAEIITKENERIFIEINAQVIYDDDKKHKGIEGVFRDVTERVKNEQLIKESEEKFKSVVNSMDDIIFVLDKDNRFTTVYSQHHELFIKPNMFIGKKHKDIMPENINDLFNIAMINVKKGLVEEYEYSLELHGTIKWYGLKISPIFDNGLFNGSVSVVRDITTRFEHEKEIILAKEKAEESDQLKTDFLHNMSHEIRTPLNGIIGFSEFLNMPDLAEENKKKYVGIIQNSGYQLLRIIDDILEISQLGTNQVKVHEDKHRLNDICLEIFSIFNIKSKENKTPLFLKTGLSDEESTIYTDSLKLNKILSNLLENALKFTNTGFVEFGYKLIETNGQKLIQLYVKDTGIGVSKGRQTMIFDRFSQEDKGLTRSHGGLGLGLSIAKENTELLGGTISLESEKYKGSTFYVTIPYTPVFENTVIDNNNETEYTILIAEDEAVNYLYLETLLSAELKNKDKIKYLHAKNGEEVIEICKNDDNNIDIIFMDLKMPELDGFKATKIIKELYPDLTIIAQTAYSTKDEMEKAKLAGCDNFISKPITQKGIRIIIEEYIK